MNKPTVFLLAALSLAVATAGCTGSGAGVGPSASTSVAPPPPTSSSIPSSVAPPTTVTATSTTAPSTTGPATVVPATTAPTTQPGTTVPATNPAGVPAAVTGDPILTDIPGKLIDYVPAVAANLDIDVPGQYYEILPKFYVFIPTEDSATNPNLRMPTPERIPVLESFVRAVAALWAAYLTNPVPPESTPEIHATFTADGSARQDPILAAGAERQTYEIIRSGNLFVPRVTSPEFVESCSWLDQKEVFQDGATYEEEHEARHFIGEVAVEADKLKLARLRWDHSPCL